MLSCNKRKQIKPQKIFEKAASLQTEANQNSIKFKSDQSSTGMSRTKCEPVEPSVDINEQFTEKLRTLVDQEALSLNNPTSQPHIDMVKLIEKIIFTNIMPIFNNLSSNSQFKNSTDQLALPTKPLSPVPEPPLTPAKNPNTDSTNPTDLIKDSIEKFFSSNDSKVNYLQSSNTTSFESPNIRSINKDASTTKRKAQDYTNESVNNKIMKTSTKEASNHMNYFSQNSNRFNTMPIKMVRGQEEWVNNSRHKSFISQILKCMECSASFDTLAELSVHMLNSNHFLKFQPNNLNQHQFSDSNQHAPNADNNNKLEISYQDTQKSTMFYQSYQKPKSTRNNTKYFKVKESHSVCKLKNVIPSKTICQICSKTFDHSSKKSHNHQQHKQQALPPLVKLIQHLQNTHQIDHICTNCGSFFGTRDELQNHLVEESFNHQYALAATKKQKHTSDFTKYQRINNNNMNNQNSTELNESGHGKSHSSLSVSVSPALSTSDSAFSSNSCSSNSSPSSFLFEASSHKTDKNQVSNDDKKSQQSNTGNHLLALQMLVNGNGKLSPSNSSSSSKTVSPRSDVSVGVSEPFNKSSKNVNKVTKVRTVQAAIKLPAKKRPYVDIDADVCAQVNDDVKLSKSGELKEDSMSKENTCRPLSSLQKMHLCLDEFFMR